MSIDLATQETKIRKEITVPASLGKKVCKTPSQKDKKLGVVVCACYPSYNRKGKVGGLGSRLTWAK
jgi:hypothetical protein